MVRTAGAAETAEAAGTAKTVETAEAAGTEEVLVAATYGAA